VLYGLVADDGSTPVDPGTAQTFGASAPATGAAEAWPGDDPVDERPGDGNERSSALRRLISSLRRKDH
jgi:hypothetical protein